MGTWCGVAGRLRHPSLRPCPLLPVSVSLRDLPSASRRRPASRGPLRFLLKPDNRSPRYSGRDGRWAGERGRRLEGYRAALLGSLGAGAAGVLGGAAPERPWAGRAVGRVVFRILRKSALFRVCTLARPPSPNLEAQAAVTRARVVLSELPCNRSVLLHLVVPLLTIVS